VSQRRLQDLLFFCIVPKDSQIHMKLAFAALILGLSATPTLAHTNDYKVKESINLMTTKNCHMHPKKMVFHCHKHTAGHHKNDQNAMYYDHKHVNKHHHHHHHDNIIIKIK